MPQITNGAYIAYLFGAQDELKKCEECKATNLKKQLKEVEVLIDFKPVKMELCYFCRKRYKVLDR